ncbi:hypothetical protein CREGCYN_06470 [Synechococcus sp. M16CYN]
MDITLLVAASLVAVLAGLTLHWQHRWTVAFDRLESTRIQAYRLTESTAVMEQHWLRNTTQPVNLVPTRAINLVHIRHPASAEQPSPKVSISLFLSHLVSQRLRSGY